MADAQDMTIRTATTRDHATLAALLLNMLADMQSYGGLELADESSRRTHIDEMLQRQLADPLCRYFLAETQAEPTCAVGMLGAQILTPPALFKPMRSLHCSAVYVQPPHRGAGLAQSLIRCALDWARAEACVQANLTVLVGNPAGRLYERLGFEAVEQKLVLANLGAVTSS